MEYTDSRVFTIAPDMPFIDSLAIGMIAMSESKICELANFTVFLPSKRACFTLREAFSRITSGRPMLLPQLVPIGEIDEVLPVFGHIITNLLPEIPPLRRRLLLTRLILGGQGTAILSPAQAIKLSSSLEHLLDEVQTQRLVFETLSTLVPADYASHWQITLDFLIILEKVWPQILAAEKYLDSAVRRDTVIRALLTSWKREPPTGPVIMAGLAHADPVLTDLVTAIATLPAGEERSGGYIVLPGLDRTLDDKSWDTINETHPQAGLKSLVTALHISRRHVPDWLTPQQSPFSSSARPHPDRLRLVTEALRPAEMTDGWQKMTPLSRNTLCGVNYLECASLDEEARVIALLLRENLEHKGQTAALVTTDRMLARRVAAELERWDILIDDSAGIPLSQTLHGIFLRLTSELSENNFDILSLIEIFKHPLTAATYAPGYCKKIVCLSEKQFLRHISPVQGLTGLKAALGNSPIHITFYGLLDWLEKTAANFMTLMQQKGEVPLTALVKAHIAFSENLAASTTQSGSERLWEHDTGISAAAFITDLLEAADTFPCLQPRFYPALLDSCMENYTVRPTDGRHPRLSIWGPLEARLQHPDLLILGGLNEGTWPPVPDVDPWMSPSMRVRFGLSPPERRIGLSAHDFVHAFCAPRVVMTRSQRADGVETVPSRWLLRLNAVLRTTGLQNITSNVWQDAELWRLWARALNWPQIFIRPVRPAPRPPLSARPKRLSVTEISTLIRDPYAIYAKRVLRLQPLSPLTNHFEAAHYGILVHKALEMFLKHWSSTIETSPSINPEEALLAVGQQIFTTTITKPGIQAFWWPRFQRVARWITTHERRRRQRGAQIFPEVYGQLMLTIQTSHYKKWLQPFLLTARADRIELLPGNQLIIIDYKTGLLPSQYEVSIGYEPQLPLEAAMAAAGAFTGIPHGSKPEACLYWHLTGMNAGGEERRAGDNTPAMTLAIQALEGLQTLLTTFFCEKTAYEACMHPIRYSYYQHLARTKEWVMNEEQFS